MTNPIQRVAALFDQAKVRYAFIGAHAVNVWLEPRITADIDVTAEAAAEDLECLRGVLGNAGFAVAQEHGGANPSGPDFIRFASADGVVLEVQIAKTQFQREVIRRAVRVPPAILVATAEDLIVMKLIANRPKDRADLAGLVAIPHIDWGYVTRWAHEWGVADRLEETHHHRK